MVNWSKNYEMLAAFPPFEYNISISAKSFLIGKNILYPIENNEQKKPKFIPYRWSSNDPNAIYSYTRSL